MGKREPEFSCRVPEPGWVEVRFVMPAVPGLEPRPRELRGRAAAHATIRHVLALASGLAVGAGVPPAMRDMLMLVADKVTGGRDDEN